MSTLNLNDNCPVCQRPRDFKRKTCSRECSDTFKKTQSREERICLECQIPFSAKIKTPNKLCSDLCRKNWGLRPENKQKRLDSAIKAVEEKYGVKSTLSLDITREKVKITKKEKYGDENYNNYKKAKETNLEKYGSNHVLESDIIREKGNLTKKDKYGDENYNNRVKAKTTNQEKYNVDYAIQSEEFKLKQQNTNLKNWGVKNPLQNKEIMDKKNKTNLLKYGHEIASKNEDVKQKIKLSYYEKFPESLIFDKLKSNNLELLTPYMGLRTDHIMIIYEFKCNQCSSIFQGTFSNNKPPICRVCYPMYKNNKIQQEFRDFLNSIFFENLFLENDKSVIKPFELDFLIPTKGIAIELNGNYYHSEIGGEKSRLYHLNKTKMCHEKDIKLIHIFEDEWMYKKEIVKSKIKNLLGVTSDTIFARKCEIKIVPLEDKKLFLDKYHIQGNTVDEIRLGLYYNNELQSMITFLKLRNWLGDPQKRDNSWELSRFCNKADVNIPGGFSKLLSHFKKNYSPNFILTFADCRWSGLNYDNTVYIKNNFQFIKFTPPSYWYFKKGDYLQRYHRYTFNKKKLNKLLSEETGILPQLTEWELAQKLKMDRIWDCGNIRFEMHLNK